VISSSISPLQYLALNALSIATFSSANDSDEDLNPVHSLSLKMFESSIPRNLIVIHSS